MTAESSVARPPPLSLYVHIPWCVRKCPYCDFNSHAARADLPESAYADALTGDFQAALPEIGDRVFDTLYFGGGTPSLFSPDAVHRLITVFGSGGRLRPGAEITLEVNPGTAEQGRFRAYRDAGVNRLSIGVQSFNDASLRRLGRIHGAAEAQRAAELAASLFDNFNIDLMYGLPEQTAAQAAADVGTAIGFGPAHLSCYQLTLEPNTVFARYPPELPGDAVQARIETAVEEQLLRGGFENYEVSANARDGRECRHNRQYWEFGDYLGIGAGAHTKLTMAGRVRRESRLRSPQAYLRRAGTPAAVASRHELGPADLLLEFMMNALRLTGGFTLGLFAARTGLPAQTAREPLQRAERRGLLVSNGDRFYPTAAGRRFLNELLSEFLPA